MNHMNETPTGQSTESTEIYAAKLALIGNGLSTLGDGLQTIAAAIALQQLEMTNQANQSDHSRQLEIMQNQIDHLTSKIESMERRNS